MNKHPEIRLPGEYPWGIAVLDASDGRVLDANHCMREIYDCAPGDWLESRFRLLSFASFAELAATLAAGGSWSGRINPRNSRHGISSTEVMLQLDPDSADRIWLYTLEHPRVNNQLRFSSRSELKMLRVLLDNTFEYVFFRDIQGYFILTNKAFHDQVADGERYPGVDTRIEDFLSPESATWLGALDDRVRQTGEAAINEVAEVVFNNGIKHWLQLTTAPVRSGEGETVGFLSVARDISDLKRTESELRQAIDRANQASKAKSQFLAAMSHEIRTPINGIIGASELCQETELDNEQKSYVDTVVQCGNTLLTLVNDVLDFSKIEAGQLSLEKLNFNPRNTIEDVAEEFFQMVRLKKVELIVACSEDVPSFLMGDPTRFKQVLYNLLSNAVKFTEKGEIVIAAEVVELNDRSARLRFEVRDTGIGIAPTRREAIFESFTQADMSTSRKYGGTGLGLAICRELVSLMGGEIGVSSEEGRGSCFYFEIPFERAAVIGADSVPFNPELAGMRVLIVDDNPTNREIYAQMCAGWGYRSVTAADGLSALKLMEDATREDDRFELIILDQQMPGLTGIDLASLIKSRPDLREAKVIMLSSSSFDRADSERAEAIGVDRALTKPVKRATLLEVILESFQVGQAVHDKAAVGQEAMEENPKPMRLLLAEDNVVNQAVASKRLEKLGHQVTVASDGGAALAQVRQNRFDGIFMDIQMPGMDGYETTAAIRRYEMGEGLAPHWIVAMTAHALKGDAERCLEAGMDDYIAKPFRVNHLKEVLRRMDKEGRRTADDPAVPKEKAEQSVAAFLESLGPEDREDRLEAAELFIETLPEEILKLEEAVRARDADQIRFVTHSLKGVSGLFGDKESVAHAGALEALADSDDLKAHEAKLQDLARKLNERLHALAAEIGAVLKQEPG